MVRSLIGRVAGVGALALGLAGCGGHTTNAVLCTVPATSDAGACRYQPDYRYRFDPNKAKEKGKQSLVVVSLSGGRVRASALAYGTPLALGELTREVSPTLLADVHIISSVSGGSVTAGWYALHGADGLGEGNRLRRLLDHV